MNLFRKLSFSFWLILAGIGAKKIEYEHNAIKIRYGSFVGRDHFDTRGRGRRRAHKKCRGLMLASREIDVRQSRDVNWRQMRRDPCGYYSLHTMCPMPKHLFSEPLAVREACN